MSNDEGMGGHRNPTQPSKQPNTRKNDDFRRSYLLTAEQTETILDAAENSQDALNEAWMAIGLERKFCWTTIVGLSLITHKGSLIFSFDADDEIPLSYNPPLIITNPMPYDLTRSYILTDLSPPSYACVGGPPDRWYDLDVLLDGAVITDVIEVNTLEGWAIRQQQDQQGCLIIENDRVATYRHEGNYSLKWRVL